MSVNFNPLAQAALFQQFGLIGPLRHGLVDRVYHLFQPLIFIAEDVKRTFSPPEKTLLDLTIDAYVQSNRIEEDFDKVKPDLLLAFPQAKRWQIEQFKMIFQTLSDEKLNTFLTELFKQEAEGSIALLIDRLTKVLSLEKVESAIHLDSLSDSQTFGVLSDAVQENGAGLIVEPEAIRKLAYIRNEDRRFKEVVQPFTSMSILDQAFAKARPNLEDSSIERGMLEDKKRELECTQKSISHLYTDQGKKMLRDKQEIEKQIAEIDERRTLQQKKTEAFERLLHTEHHRRTTELWASMPLSDLIKQEKATDKDLLSFILFHHYLGHGMRALIEEKKQLHPNAFTVNTQLIDQLLAEHSKHKKTDDQAIPETIETGLLAYLHSFLFGNVVQQNVQGED